MFEIHIFRLPFLTFLLLSDLFPYFLWIVLRQRNIYLFGTQLPCLAKVQLLSAVSAVSHSNSNLVRPRCARPYKIRRVPIRMRSCRHILTWLDSLRNAETAERSWTERYRQRCVPNRHFFGLAALFSVLAESHFYLKIWNWPYQILWRPKSAVTK